METQARCETGPSRRVDKKLRGKSRDATVTLCHSRTRDLAAICREADVLVAAVGKPGFVSREFVREGAVVIDVGINRLTSLEDAPERLRRSERLREALEEKGRAVVGDVDFEDVAPVAGWITAVPGGVGPLTVAMLLQNTVKAVGFLALQNMKAGQKSLI